MKLEFITAGQVVNTHGIRGEIKLLPQPGLEPKLIARCKTLYIQGQPVVPRTRRIHKGCVLLTLPGVEDMDTALTYKNKTVTMRRSDLKLEKGQFFDEELVGLDAKNAETGEVLGQVAEVLDYPAHKIYTIQGGKDEYMVTAVPAFIQSIDLEENAMMIHVWEGMGSHEN